MGISAGGKGGATISLHMLLFSIVCFYKYLFLLCRDSLIVAFGNCLTSFFAGFVIFSYLGYLATEAGQPVESVVDSG